MDGRGLLVAGQRHIQRVTQNVGGRVIGGVRDGQDVLEIGCAKLLDVGVVLDVVWIVHGEKAKIHRAVIKRQIGEEQRKQDERVDMPAIRGELGFSGGRRQRIIGLFRAFGFHPRSEQS
jgi:hypothetical protein